jgi:hypothetical protein
MMIMARPAHASAHRGGFDVDEERALVALRLTWGDAYAICFDDAIIEGSARWRAWRLGGGTAITGSTSDELNTAIRADWGAA